MEWKLGRRVLRAVAKPRVSIVIAVAAAFGLAGCNHDGQPTASLGQPRGATIAFESIDGPPSAQFQTLVRDLNDQAQTLRLAVISRESPSVYRVRGYLAARVVKNETTISWVWDVFDQDDRRALRITGEETAKGRHRDAWAAADEALLRRIAESSMNQLAAFLTTPGATPPAAAPATDAVPVALLGPQGTTPESAGIYRIYQATADPVQGAGASPDGAAPVPLPPRRPAAEQVVSGGKTLALAAVTRD